jgi:hypothetical protein
MLDVINEQLKVKQLAGEKNSEFIISDIDMVDVPTPDALAACIEKLYSIGYISIKSPQWDPNRKILLQSEIRDRFSITKLGAIANIFSMMPPELSRAILAAYSWDASVLDLITIAAYMKLDSRSFIKAASPSDDSDTPPPRV